ncbi:MAG: 4Fe-4S dicluster domain-containing protein [Acidobacteria bacterium]|nr:MAG: 4Fe-4S dicluster domain-containing protein [Acidobacteriota bacterium]
MADLKYKTVVPDMEFWKRMIPCQAACPVYTDAGKYVQLIAQGEFEKSYLVARSPNPLASVCGRVCAAPCEDSCRRGKIDAPVSIRALKRFICEKYGVESRLPDTQDPLFSGESDAGNQVAWHLPVLSQREGGVGSKQKAAVIGAGPAGVACAHDLALLGYDVTLFEASDALGGMLTHGIPEFRLPRSVTDKEIEKIFGLGVKVKLNAPLSADFGLEDLRRLGFEAIFLSVGTQRGRELNIEGANLDGVVKAVDFLLNVNHGFRLELGERVVVIGGGFVAFDAARMALRAALQPDFDPQAAGVMPAALDAARAAVRAGVADVRICSLESFDEMPALRTEQGREEFAEARREGVHFHPQRGPARILGKDGRVAAVELVGVRRTYDPDGRFNPVYTPEIKELLEADSVILAVGQQADLSFLKPADCVKVTPRGTIAIDAGTLATTAPGVYAGGDVAFGPRNLIDAVANGKRAAISIDQYLRAKSGGPTVELTVEKIPTRLYSMAEDYEKLARQAPPSVPLDRRTGISEVEAGYSEPEAKDQAERCLYCHIQTIYDAEKCVLCNRCVDVCPEHCLKLVPVEALDLDPQLVKDTTAFAGVSGDGPFSAMIKDDEKCIRCGLCAKRCPTDAMTMEVFHYVER